MSHNGPDALNRGLAEQGIEEGGGKWYRRDEEWDHKDTSELDVQLYTFLYILQRTGWARFLAAVDPLTPLNIGHTTIQSSRAETLLAKIKIS